MQMRLIIAVVLTAITLPAIELTAQPVSTVDKTTASLDAILNKHWKRDYTHREKAAGEYRSASSELVPSPDLLMAYMLNRAFHRKYGEAAKVAEQLEDICPDCLDANYAQTWFHLAYSDVNPAIASLDRWIRGIDSTDAMPKDLRLLQANRMGRLIGFIAGPKKKQVSDEQYLRATTDKILAILKPDEQQAFKDSFNTVVTRYKELVSAADRAEEAQIEKKRQEREQKLQELTQHMDAMHKQREELSAELGKIRDRSRKEIGDLEKRAAPMRSKASSLDASAASLSGDLSLLYSDIAYLESQAFAEPDPVLRADLLRRADSLRRTATQKDSRLNQIVSQLDGVMAQLSKLDAEINQKQNEANSVTRDIQDALNEIAREQRRNSNELKRLNRKPSGRSSHEFSLENRARSLSTYDPFPVEMMRQSLLTKFGLD